MGQLRFVVPHRDRLPAEALQRAYLSGMEGIPWRCTNSWVESRPEGGEFVVERGVGDSGTLFIPWYLDGREMMLSTATLMERAQPYNLPVELARGLINRLRNQSAEWAMIGLEVPAEFTSGLRAASRRLVDAITTASSEDQAADAAEEAIQMGMEILDLLAAEYIRQAVAARAQQTSPLPTLFGAHLTQRPLSERESELLPQALNTVSLGASWRDLEATAGRREWDELDQQLEWCRDQGFRVLGGPLLQLNSRDVPDWLYLWEDDFEQVQSYVLQHVQALVQRCRGKVHIWNCAARINVPDALSLSEEQRLRLVVNIIEEVKHADPATPLIVSLDRPWAEYLASEDLDLSPLHFADSLLRADLGIAGIGLEINLGYWPGGTLPRDLLEVSRMMDRWSLLGIPLIVYLTVPSAVAPPEDARQPTCVPLQAFAGGATPETQQREVKRLVEVLLAKPYIQGIIWNQLSDADGPVFVHSGLFDARHCPKPVLETLTSLRQQHLT